jgi:hypothetical protein
MLWQFRPLPEEKKGTQMLTFRAPSPISEQTKAAGPITVQQAVALLLHNTTTSSAGGAAQYNKQSHCPEGAGTVVQKFDAYPRAGSEGAQLPTGCHVQNMLLCTPSLMFFLHLLSISHTPDFGRKALISGCYIASTSRKEVRSLAMYE